MKSKFILLIIVAITVRVFTSCEQPGEPLIEKTLAKVRTVSVNDITTTHAVVVGSIADNGNDEITEKGFCWTEKSFSPRIQDSVIRVSGQEEDFSDTLNLAPGKIYYVSAFAVNSVGVAYGNTLKIKTLGKLPQVEAVTIDCTQHTATIKAEIDNGDLDIKVSLEYGLTNTYSDSIKIDTASTGISVDILDLNYSTKYYYLIKLRNSIGEAKFNGSFTTKNPTVTDIDGNVYQSVKIGDQIWIAENLKVTHYNDGTEIPNLISDEDWIKAGEEASGAYCYYNNDPKLGEVYGALYNWYAVNTGKLAPKGWHVPTNAEWEKLTLTLANMSNSCSGYACREKGTEHWTSPNDATNISGFTALGGGWRGFSKQKIYCFGDLLESGAWWAADEMRPGVAFIAWTDHDSKWLITSNSCSNDGGSSVRLVKD